MLLSGFKTLVAFYISGICYRVLIDGQVLTSDLIMNIIILEDIPGYSEFLVSFSLFIFIGMTLFKPLQMLIEHKKTFWMICILLLFTTFIPYENVSINPFGLLLGSTSFASFPVLQYLPFYLIGIYFARYQIHFNPRLFIGAIVCTMIFSFYLVSKGHLPSRFPPTFIWIIGPAFFLYIYYLLAKPLAKIGKWMKPIEFMGRNVLFYLLISNLFIFTLKGRQSILILSTFESLIVAIIIMLIIGYLIWIITKQGKKYVKT